MNIKNIKNKFSVFWVILFLLLPIAFLGCSGGGGDASAPSLNPSIQVFPSDYYFGIVTPGNSPAPLEVEIQNKGSVALNVSSIALLDITNFVLHPNRGSKPCNTTSPSIAPGGNCTVEVEFNPPPGPPDSFLTNLKIISNASNTPELNVPLNGSLDDISTLNVRINQVETCPGPVVTAYVSVTDQGGYPVTTLTKNDFSVTEDATLIVGAPTSTSFVSNTAYLSVALVMDYSGSITDVQDNVDDMEESVVNFVDQLGRDDEAEIIKFDQEYEVVQEFTSNKALLTAAITDPWDMGPGTRLYDAVVQAVDDTALSLKDRKAVIVVTDGTDDDGSGNQLSINGLDDAINYANANGVPIFTVGLGQQIDSAVLKQLAKDTGGQYYESTTSDNLRTIYQQLADLLFLDSYILTYTSGLGVNVTADLTIEAAYSPTITGVDTKEIISCP